MRLAALAFAALAVVAARARADDPCVSPPVGKAVPFAVGESLEYDIDSLGATIGSFRMTVMPGRGDAPYVLQAIAKTGTFASTFYSVDAVATSKLGRGLENRIYQEDATEAGVHRTVDVNFPVEKGQLKVVATREGNHEDYEVNAPSDTRDLLAALYTVRAMNLPEGTEICVPVFGARRVWILRAKVAGKEKARTPAGDFKTVKIVGTAVREDAPGVKREVQFWLSDDASKMPVAACGLVQNKPVCANLKSYDPGRKKLAAAPRR